MTNKEDWLDYGANDNLNNKITRVFEISGICGCGDPENALLIMLDIRYGG